MLLPYLLFLALQQGCCYGLWSAEQKLFRPHVETYWESWEDGKGNFAANLTDVPVTPLGSKHGVNIVNIAFATPRAANDDDCNSNEGCITEGLYGDPVKLQEAIQAIHEKGGFVKLAIGGATYGDLGENLTEAEYATFAKRISNVVNHYNMDGVDLTQSYDCGFVGDCFGLGRKQIEIIPLLRKELPDKLISYTFPWESSMYDLNGLYGPVINATHQYLDTVNIFNGDLKPIDYLVNKLGLPRHKIVWGINLALDCDLEMTTTASLHIKRGGYGGVMTWSINGDTAQRDDWPFGVCNDFQTGEKDGTYNDLISFLINQH